MRIADVFSTGVTNLGLRGISLLGKFVFVLFLAKYLSLEDFGKYGLLATLVAFSVQVIGFDYYVYNTRRIIRSESPTYRSNRIVSQIRMHLLTYGMYVAVFIALDVIGVVPTSWAWGTLLVLIVVSEHISQESSRMLTALSKSIQANWVFLFRTAIWMALFMLWSIQWGRDAGLENVLSFWCVGAIAAALLGSYRIWRLFEWKWKRRSLKNTWEDWKTGFKYAFPLFLSTLGLQVVEVSDRFMIEYFMGTKPVGIYVFSQNLGTILQTIAVVGLISIVAPRLIGAFSNNKIAIYDRTYFFMAISLVGVVAFFGIILITLFPLAAEIAGKEELKNSNGLFVIVLVGYIFAIMGMLPYYSLYIRKRDWAIAWTAIGGAGINAGLNIVLIPSMGLVGAAYSTIIAFVLIMSIRIVLVFRLKQSVLRT